MVNLTMVMNENICKKKNMVFCRVLSVTGTLWLFNIAMENPL